MVGAFLERPAAPEPSQGTEPSAKAGTITAAASADNFVFLTRCAVCRARRATLAFRAAATSHLLGALAIAASAPYAESSEISLQSAVAAEMVSMLS